MQKIVLTKIKDWERRGKRMKRKHVKKLTAVVTVGMMFTGMLGMQTFAAEEVEPTSSLSKVVTKEANVYTPNTTFTFKIKSGTSETATADKDAVYEGPTGGIYFVNRQGISIGDTAEITSVPTLTDAVSQSGAEVTVGTAKIEYDLSKFTKPGIYRYEVSESQGDYEGIKYDTSVKYFDVYVVSDDEGSLSVNYAAFIDKNDPKVKDDGTFTNDYSSKHDTLKDLEIKKEVTGNQGDKTNKAFQFTIKVEGTSGECYNLQLPDGSFEKMNSGTEKTISLKNGQTAKIYGLSASDICTVTENDYSSDGYTTTIDDVETRQTSGTLTTIAGTTDNKGDVKVTVVNDKNTTSPTGIVMMIAPYVILVSAALVAGLLFFRRKRLY